MHIPSFLSPIATAKFGDSFFEIGGGNAHPGTSLDACSIIGVNIFRQP
jgi:hypothetical protein